MTRSANRSMHPVETVKTDVKWLTAKLTGGGAGDLVVADPVSGNSDVVTAVRTAAGKYTITTRYVYPQLLVAPWFAFDGTTDGLVGQSNACVVTTGVYPIEIYVGSTATDLATTDTIYMCWVVRNSGKNQ